MNQVNCPVCGMKYVKYERQKQVRNGDFAKIEKHH